MALNLILTPCSVAEFAAQQHTQAVHDSGLRTLAKTAVTSPYGTVIKDAVAGQRKVWRLLHSLRKLGIRLRVA